MTTKFLARILLRCTEKMPGKTLLSFFWDLASTNEDIRINAAVELIQYLQTSKKGEKAVDDDSSEARPDDFSYTIKRLVKGLASSRKAARQGFAMALTEIILLFDNITTENIIEYMKDSLTVTKSTSTQEERDTYIGQIFGLFSLGRASCLAQTYGNATVQKSSITFVVERLKELSFKKSYLRETCCKAIVDLITMLNFSEFQQSIFPVLESDLKCSVEKCSPDSLLLILATWRLFKDHLSHKLFKKWTSRHLDSVENYPALAQILQNSHYTHPRVHIVWDEVLHSVLNSSKSDLGKFWTLGIDDKLFQSSHERKFLGFKILEKILPMLDLEEQVEVVFSQQLMRCLFNSLAHSTNYLYAATKQIFEGIGHKMVYKQALIPHVIKQLVGRNGNVRFDTSTKTKTIETLVSKVNVDNLPALVSWLEDVFVGATTDPKNLAVSGFAAHVEKTREGILGLFFTLIKCKQLEHTSTWVLDIVYFVFESAYFVRKDLPPISDRTRRLCQQRFNSILGELASLSTKPNTSADKDVIDASTGSQRRKFGCAENGRLWISYIMSHAKELIKDDTVQVVGKGWTEEVQSVFNKTMKLVKKIEQKSSDATPENHAFTLMFLYVGVQLFGEPQQARDMLEELFQCFDKVKEQMLDKTEGNEPHWMDVVTEILLSLLTDASNLRRQIVDQVFHSIVSNLTSSSLKIILEAVDPRNGLDEDSALQIEGDEDEEMVSDENEPEEAPSEDSEEEDLSDDNDDDVRDSVDPLFKIDLQAALGNALANERQQGKDGGDDDNDGDGDDDDDNDGESSDSDLDDDAMMKLDDALSEVFKQHLKAKKEKKKLKDAKKSILHFKLRVLDLIEILIKKQPSSVLILELIQPLLDIIWHSLNSRDLPTLGERAQGIYKNKLCSIKEHPQLSSSYVESVHVNIELLLKQAIKAPSVAMVTLMSAGCLFLIRQLRGGKEEDKEGMERKNKHRGKERVDEFVRLDFSRVKVAYCEALKDFMLHRNTHLHPLLFEDLINRYPAIGWSLAEDLVVYITKGINNFRKIQACVMLSHLLNRKVHTYNEHVKSIATPLQNAVKTIFDELSSDAVEMRAKHLRQILKLASQFVRVSRTEPDLWSLLDVAQLESSLDSTTKSKIVERAGDLRDLVNRLKSDITGTESSGSPERKSKKQKRKRTLSDDKVETPSMGTCEVHSRKRLADARIRNEKKKRTR